MMRDSTELPELRMLPVDKLVTHEDCDPRRTLRLSRRIMDEGLFKHPPVVAEIPDSDLFVVLDGANRTIAMRDLRMPHIVVQLVKYMEPQVVLDTWYHVVSGMKLEELNQRLENIDGGELKESSLVEARKALALHHAAAYVINEDQVRTVHQLQSLHVSEIHLVNQIVLTYLNNADIYRASNDIWEIQKPYYPKINALFVFPRLSPRAVIEAARTGPKIPTGITRHIISPRALNLNIPLWVLAADWTLEQKIDWLAGWLMERMASNAIRFYSESTFTYNEY